MKKENLIKLFKKQVSKTPDNIAVVYEKNKYSYKQLDEITDKLAKYLKTLGVKTEDTVAILIDRSEYMVIYPLAVLKAGAGYMPLDYTFPTDRLEYMLNDAQVKIVLSEGNRAENHIPNFEGMTIKKEDLSKIEFKSDIELTLPNSEDQFVVLYTSGSTGMPKGCILEHRNLANFCEFYKTYYEITEKDNGAVYANFAFDAHMMDIYPLLISGATAYIIPSIMRLDFLSLNEYFEKNHISIAFMTTLLGKQFVETFDNKSLRVLTVGGEKLPYIKLPKFPLFNAYGPTECTILTTVHKIEHEKDCLNIGKPIHNYECYILDNNMQMVSAGEVGELCIAGDGVGRGYLNRPELTAEKFVTWQGKRIYRTGDYAKWLDNGEIEFVGRIDGQVKLRGLRIELGEIESKIEEYEGITASAVTVKEIGQTQHLCAYYTSSKDVDIEDLKNVLAIDLTSFMIPSSFTRLDKMPLNSNGKINRKELPDPVIEHREGVKPRDEKEQKIFEIVSELVSSEDFGVTDDLFTVGLTSLIAIRVAVLLKKNLGFKISTNEILKGKTIENIAKAVVIENEEETLIEKRAYYPLTQNQLGVYFECEKNPNTLIYNIPMSIEFPKKIDATKLREAIVKVVNTHPYIKMHLSYKSDSLVQLRMDEAEVNVEVITNSDKTIEEIKAEFLKPFKLLDSNLYRFLVIEREEKTYLFYDIHHMIFDGGSEDIFIRDLLKAYKGEVIDLEVISAFEVAVKEEKEIASQKYENAREYFKNKLKIEATNLAQTSIKDGKKVGIANAFVDVEKVRSFCMQEGITASNLFMSAFLRVLSAYTREDNIGIATISNGRGDVNLDNTFGMFVKTLPATCNIEKDKRIIEFMKEVQNDAFETVENEIFPLTEMAAQFGFKPTIVYAFQGGILTNEKDALEYKSELLQLDAVRMPLSVNIFEEDNYRILMEYDGERYNHAYIDSLAQAIKLCVEYFIENPDSTCDKIPLISSEEANKLLEISKGESLEYDKNATFISLFKTQAKISPEKIAIVDKIGKLSYKEADEYSDKLAKHLIDFGIKQNSFVGIMLPRRKEYMVSVLATMKANCAYIPIDVEYPQDRISHILTDSRTQVLITTKAFYKEKGINAEKVVFIEDFDFEKEMELQNEVALILPDPNDLAYMIYTSGSTGKPKGVKINHAALVALTAWVVKEYSLKSGENVCCYPSFSFDASIVELFSPLTVGLTIHIISEELRFDLNEFNKYIIANNICGCSVSTQFGMEYLNQYESTLRYMMLGGEKLVPVKKNNVNIYNGYGPTEFTVVSSFHLVDQTVKYDNIPIGRSVPNSWNYVVDSNFNLVPIGVPGELCLSGIQISQGYHDREDLTNEKFINNPFKTCKENDKMYRTGDLVCWNNDGELEFLGRIDTQVKIRGFRIELGEIESVMANVDGITANIVDVKIIGNTQHICAYYTQDKEVDINQLKQQLQKSLAEYMVPTIFIKVDKMPLTPNGKIDKKVLPMPVLTGNTEYTAPRNKVEESLCKLYEKLLKVDKVGIDDDFFLIGGNSLLAMSLVAKCMAKDIKIVYGDVFEHKTPRKLFEKTEGHFDEKNLVENNYESQYDYTEINKVILKNNITDIAKTYVEKNDIGDVLLTGATGFLGIHILRELIETHSNIIYCLVREKKNISAEDRLKSLLHYYFEKDYENLFGKRIIVINGDATNPETITAKVDTVINCAANVKHFAQGDELDKINIGGVVNLIDYCQKNDAALVQISTISVGDTAKEENCPVIFDESKLYFGQDLENRYIYSKFMAERHILEAVTKGMKAKIMRVGNLMPRNSDGEFQINLNGNAFMNSLRAYKLLGMFPISAVDEVIEFSPIDSTAKAVVKLAETDLNYTIYHPANTHKVLMYDVIATMNDYGFSIDIVDDEKFNKILQEKMKDERVVKYLLGILAYQRSTETEPIYKVATDNKFTSNILLRLGVRWPITSEEYIKKAIKAVDGLGYFDIGK